MSTTDTRTSDVEQCFREIWGAMLDWDDSTINNPEAEFRIKEILTSFRERVVLDTAKAYGGCTKCYGKGYATTLQFTQSHEDFGGEKTNREQLPLIRYCSCDRGKQLKALTPHDINRIPRRKLP